MTWKPLCREARGDGSSALAQTGTTYMLMRVHMCVWQRGGRRDSLCGHHQVRVPFLCEADEFAVIKVH